MTQTRLRDAAIIACLLAVCVLAYFHFSQPPSLPAWVGAKEGPIAHGIDKFYRSVYIKGNVETAGSSIVGEDLTVGGNVSVTGVITADSWITQSTSLDLTGGLTVDGATVLSGTTTASSTLTAPTINVTTLAATTGNVTTLTAAGTTVLSGTTTVSSTLTAPTANITTLAISGNETVAGNATITGNTLLTGTLSLSEATGTITTTGTLTPTASFYELSPAPHVASEITITLSACTQPGQLLSLYDVTTPTINIPDDNLLPGSLFTMTQYESAVLLCNGTGWVKVVLPTP